MGSSEREGSPRTEFAFSATHTVSAGTSGDEQAAVQAAQARARVLAVNGPALPAPARADKVYLDKATPAGWTYNIVCPPYGDLKQGG